MRGTRQLRRMEARTRASAPTTSINMVSLLDIFTILLLFLLVQSGDPEEALPVFENLQLPFSAARAPAKRNLVVAIDRDRILVEGRPVVTLAQVAAGNGIVPELAEALQGYVRQAAADAGAGQRFRGSVTIMGDRKVPFSVLKRVMITCASQHFGDVSLAVQPREEGSQG